MLISQDRVQVDHFHRIEGGAWPYRLLGPGDAPDLPDPAARIPIAAIFEGIEMPGNAEAAEEPA